MADIQIKLDVRDAIAQAEKLDATLASLEDNAKSVQRAFNKLNLKLRKAGLKGQFDEISKFVSSHSAKKPILLHTSLRKIRAWKGAYTIIKKEFEAHSAKNPIKLHTTIKGKGKGKKPDELPGQQKLFEENAAKQLQRSAQRRDVLGVGGAKHYATGDFDPFAGSKVRPVTDFGRQIERKHDKQLYEDYEKDAAAIMKRHASREGIKKERQAVRELDSIKTRIATIGKDIAEQHALLGKAPKDRSLKKFLESEILLLKKEQMELVKSLRLRTQTVRFADMGAIERSRERQARRKRVGDPIKAQHAALRQAMDKENEILKKDAEHRIRREESRAKTINKIKEKEAAKKRAWGPMQADDAAYQRKKDLEEHKALQREKLWDPSLKAEDAIAGAKRREREQQRKTEEHRRDRAIRRQATMEKIARRQEVTGAMKATVKDTRAASTKQWLDLESQAVPLKQQIADKTQAISQRVSEIGAKTKQWLTSKRSIDSITGKIRRKAKVVGDHIKDQFKNTKKMEGELKKVEQVQQKVTKNVSTEAKARRQAIKEAALARRAGIKERRDLLEDPRRKAQPGTPARKEWLDARIKANDKAIEAEKKLQDLIKGTTTAETDKKTATDKSSQSLDNATTQNKKYNKTLEKYDDLIAKGSRNSKQVQEDLEKERQSLVNAEVAFKKVTKGQKGYRQAKKEFNKTVRQSNKRLKVLGKEMNSMRGGAGILASVFGRVTMALTAVAATLFIFQELKQYMTALIKIGSDYVKTLADIEAQTGRTAESAETLADKFKNMGQDTALSLEDTYSAYKELTKQGLTAGDAIAKSVITARMARNENLELSEAAYLAAYGTQEMVNAWLKYDKAISGSATDAWAKMKKDVGEVIAEFYKQEEPTFIRIIKDLGDFSTAILPPLLAGIGSLVLAFDGLLLILKPVLKVLSGINRILKELPPITEIFSPDKLSLEDQLKAAEESLKRISGMAKSTVQEDFAEITFDVGEEKIQDVKLTFAKLNELAGSSNDKIATLARFILDLRQKIKDLNDETGLMKLDEALKVYTDAFKKTGITTTFYQSQTRLEFEKTQNLIMQAANAAEKYGDPVGAAQLRNQAKLIADIDEYKQKQLEVSALVKDQSKYFSVVGSAQREYLTNKESELAFETKLMAIRKSLTPEQIKTYTVLKKIKNAQAALKPEMDKYAKAFQTTGQMSQKYYGMRRQQIEEEIIAMKALNIQFDEQLYREMQIQKLRAEKEAPKVARHEAVFQQTGVMTDYLAEQKRIQNFESSWNAMLQTTSQAERDKIWDAKISKDIQITRDQLATKLGFWQNYYNEVGIGREKQRELMIQDLALQRQQALLHYKGLEDVVNEYYDRLKENMSFEIDVTKPLESWEQLYSKTGMMSEEHYKLQVKTNDRIYKHLEQKLGASVELYRAYQKAVEETTIQRLESSNSMADGIVAGTKRIALEQKTAAKLTSEMWVSGMKSMEDAMVQFVSKGKVEWDSLIESMIASMARLATNQIFAGLFNFALSNTNIGSGSWSGYANDTRGNSFGGNTFASGGYVPARSQAIVGEQGPEILTMGNRPGYITPNHRIAGGSPNVKVVVNNNTGQQAEVTQDGPEFNGQEWVMNVWLDAYDRNKDGFRDRIGG